jgi:hypothetical protein
MQEHSHRRLANMAAVFTCSLAFAAFLAGSWQGRAQAATAPWNPKNPAILDLSERPGDLTPLEVRDGRAALVSHYNPEQKLRLTLAVKPPYMAEEEQFLNELVTGGSPNFHKFLTADEWNARFAPSSEDEQAVVDWAQSQGLTVTHRFPNRLLVDFEAPSGVVEKAFGVTINNYQVRGEVDFSNDRDPVLPSNLAHIVYSVQGLNNIQREHSTRPGSDRKGPDYAPGPAFAAGSSDRKDGDPTKLPGPRSEVLRAKQKITNGFLDPTDLYSSQVYNYNGLQNLGHCCNPLGNANNSPPQSSIAIGAVGNFLGSDIAGFQAGYPYLAYNWVSYTVDGSIDCTTDPEDCPSQATTQSLEWSIATANSFGSSADTAQLSVYIGPNYNNSTITDIYNYILSYGYARVFTTDISCTEVYGCSTSTMDALHSIFNSMIGQGWTLIAASGDRGSSDDCNFDNPAHESVAYPGSDYDVLAAGGTQLEVYNDGTWDYEHGWQGGTYFGACGQNDGGSGGGVSSYYGKPGFQGYSTWSGSSNRQTPDISLNALGVGQNLYIDGSFEGDANGTSIVSPELAGFFAQENAYLLSIGDICGSGTSACAPVGSPMQYFYAAAYYGAGYVSHFPFYDMTTGCNNNDVTAAQGLGYYCAQTGWDNVTGWGSANMLQLAWAINWYFIPATGSSPTVTWSGPSTGKWYNTDQVVSWTINDSEPAGSTPGSGIAGFTQGWDSIPNDSYSMPHGGTGDSFWSGPQYPNASTGCMSFNGLDGCAGGSGQGCHTANVRGWNNQGWTTGDTLYGPICYDTVAPTISAATNPVTSGTTWVNKSVVVTLTATDPGGSNASGIYKTYYAINSTSCYPGSVSTCSVYTAPFTVSTPGQSQIYYFTEDNAGNFSTEPYIWVGIDLSSPVTTPTLSGTLARGKYYSDVQVTLSSTDSGGSGIAATYYELDGGSQKTYSAPFAVSKVGSHSVKYWSVNGAGTAGTKLTTSFAIAGLPGSLTLPTPGSTLATTTETFKWTAGTAATDYELWLGSTGVGSKNIHASSKSKATSLKVTGLPTSGEKIYARLITFFGTVQVNEDYTYTAK